MELDIKEILSYYLFFIISGVAILIALFHMLYTRRSPTSMIVWFLLMVIVPYIFIFLYLLFGTRKNRFNKRKTNLNYHNAPHEEPFGYGSGKILQSNHISALTTNNNLHIYTDSNVVFMQFIQCLNEAKRSIKIGTYIFKYDDTTKEIIAILEKKQSQGVQVEILMDMVGSYHIFLFRAPLKKLKKLGAKIYFFAPPFIFDFLTKLNLRYHRKIYLIDDEILFSGGMNLSREYMGNQNSQNHWIDLMFKAQGDIVKYYVEVFNFDIAYVAKKPTSQTLLKSLNNSTYNQPLQIIPSGPDVNGDVLLEVILNAIYNAKKRIWIITPYFIPDETILQAIKIASSKGVDIKLITPFKSDHLVVDLARSSYIRQLQGYVDIILHSQKMIHAKAILFDDEAVLFGSSNLDYRSLLLNYEIVTISYFKEHIAAIEQWMQTLCKQGSHEFKPAGKIRKIFENSMRIFASQL